MTTNPNPTLTIPEEMTEALQQVIRSAERVRREADAAITTATNWLAGEAAFGFPMGAGVYGSAAAELEAAVARYEAFRSVAHKIAAFEAGR